VKKYSYPQEVDDQTLHAQADRRRAALIAAGCATHTFGYSGGQLAIICLCCGLGSVNENDISNRYCGFCHEFHNEWASSE